MKKSDLITIIIPTYSKTQNYRYIKKTVAKIFLEAKLLKIRVQVVIYVNEIDAIEKYKKNFSKLNKYVFYLQSSVNKGFTGAVNEGLLWSYVHLNQSLFIVLNDDVVLNKNFLKKIIKDGEKNQGRCFSYAVESSSGVLESFGLNYHSSGLAFPNKNLDKNISYLCGTCMCIPVEVYVRELKNNGYFFNPLYFAYAEDLELSLRQIMSGNLPKNINRKILKHLGSVTAKRGSFTQLYYGYRNLFLTVLLLWSKETIQKNTLNLFCGVLYILLHSLYKKHFFLFPKIIRYIYLNRSSLLYLRSQYDQKYNHMYAFEQSS